MSSSTRLIHAWQYMTIITGIIHRLGFFSNTVFRILDQWSKISCSKGHSWVGTSPSFICDDVNSSSFRNVVFEKNQDDDHNNSHIYYNRPVSGTFRGACVLLLSYLESLHPTLLMCVFLRWWKYREMMTRGGYCNKYSGVYNKALLQPLRTSFWAASVLDTGIVWVQSRWTPKVRHLKFWMS
jgi:hypothetical protein